MGAKKQLNTGKPQESNQKITGGDPSVDAARCQYEGHTNSRGGLQGPSPGRSGRQLTTASKAKKASQKSAKTHMDAEGEEDQGKG